MKPQFKNQLSQFFVNEKRYLERNSELTKLNEEMRLQVLALEAAANGILITDRKGDILWSNKSFTDLAGFTKDEVLGKNPRILNSGKQPTEFYKEMWNTILSGRTWHGELVNRRKDESLYTEDMTITPVKTSGDEITHFIAIKQDITERKKLESQLIQSQKMEVVGQLAGGIAHDFNNLLTIINGYSSTMIDGMAPKDPIRADLQEILRAGERATELVSKLLIFSRRQVTQLKVIYLNNLIIDMQKMLSRLIPESIEFILLPAKDLGAVKVDVGSFEQVLTNLVINATHAMPYGGKLTIETQNVTLDEASTFRHANIKPGDYVLLSVTDTGTGMSEEVKQHLFEPFFTTKPKDKGTGLGLATCYGIVQQSGGNIEFYSELGKGTSFKIYLPRVKEVPAEWYTSEKISDLPRGTEKILVVEDEPAVRHFTVHVLHQLGYSTVEATNGEEALQLLKKDSKHHPDCILTDVVMPRMGGKELAEKVKGFAPKIKIVFMSGYVENVELESGSVITSQNFLKKPFTSRSMAYKIREILDQK